MSSNPRKPPLGLIPRNIAEMNYCLERSVAITEATYRYSKIGMPVPEKWMTEYQDLQARYLKLEKEGQGRKSGSA